MNWKRLILFTLLLWAATALAAFLFGFVRGVLQANGREVPQWLNLAHVAVGFLTNVAVIAELARRQSERTWEHAAALMLIGWLTSLPSVLFFGFPVVAWLLQLPVFGICVGIAVPIGRRLRS
jgi:hypothetical protein